MGQLASCVRPRGTVGADSDKPNSNLEYGRVRAWTVARSTLLLREVVEIIEDYEQGALCNFRTADRGFALHVKVFTRFFACQNGASI